MNAAARILHQSNFFSGQLTDIKMPGNVCLHVILLAALMINSLAIIYVTNLYRITCSAVQHAEQQSARMQLHKGQLMLEKSSLLSGQRVQHLAEEQLGMIVPARKNIIDLSANENF